MKIEGQYVDYLKKLKKEELILIIDKFHILCDINNYPIADENLKSKKEDLINYLVDKENIWIKFIIQSLDFEDYKSLSKFNKKKGIFDPLKTYWQDIGLIFNNTMAKDTYDFIKKTLKSKKVLKEVKKNNKLYHLSKGIIVAYGVLPMAKFASLIGEDNLKIVNNYYQKNYRLENNKVIALELKNKKKINSYLKQKDIKEFKVKDFVKLGNNTYHHLNKNYQKLVKTLKNNYIFQNRDIIFLDTKIIIPYLYNNKAMEEEALENLNKNIDFYFEYANKKLKAKIINKCLELKKDFPLWEKRGFSSREDEINE